jgi:hypothetical protein
MIEYQPKCNDYMSSMGLERFNFRSDNLDADAVMEAIELLKGESAGHQEFLRGKMEKYRSAQIEFAGEIANFIRTL